jgi:ribosomal protein S21
MALNVNVKKKEKQSSTDLLKQFTKLVKSSGVVNKLKSIRYYEREESDFKKKEAALKKIEKTAVNERLKKLGKKVGR